MALMDTSCSLAEKRSVAAEAVDQLIDFLDQVDGDCDLEPSLGGSPWCGTIMGVDLELDDADLEDGGDAEPSLGWITRANGRTITAGDGDLEIDFSSNAQDLEGSLSW